MYSYSTIRTCLCMGRFYGWDTKPPVGTRRVCTRIFFVRSDFLVFLSSAALGASHQHSKMVRKSYSAYKLIDLDQHMKHRDGHMPKSSWYISEMVTLRSNKKFPHATQKGANDAPCDWLQYVLKIETRTNFLTELRRFLFWQSGAADGNPRENPM